MEKLTAAQQQQVKKMADDRLRIKLIVHGYEEEVVYSWEREELLARYTEVLATGPKVRPGAVVADPEIEKQRLAFEREKWEAEKDLEKQKLELEMQKVEMESMRLAAEQEDKKRTDDLERQKIDVERQKVKTKQMEYDDKKSNEQAATTKLLGDVMRNSVIRMGSDPIDAIAFFKSVEQLFVTYSVPKSIQARLINPYLNDRAQKVVGKLSPDVASDYGRVKDTILSEFKLSANTYLQRFNNALKTTDETYVSYASRLRGLLDYYLDSRKVTNLESLCELLVCDRIKSVLPDACLRHILSIESSSDAGWLPIKSLTSSLDCYVATHGGDVTRPQAYTIGQSAPRLLPRSPRPQFGTSFQQFRRVPQTQPRFSEHGNPRPWSGDCRPGPNRVSASKGGVTSTPVKSVRCYECHELGHVKSICPNLKRTIPAQQANVNRVGLLSKYENAAAVLESKPCNSERGEGADVNDCDELVSDEIVKLIVNEVASSSCESCVGSNMSRDDQVVNVDILNDCNEKSMSCSQVSIVDGLSSLKYVDVGVRCDRNEARKPVKALCDTGTEICIVKSELLDGMSPNVLGKVQLKPFCGNPVEADVVRLNISNDIRSVGDDDDVTVLCAVVCDLNDEMILSESVLSKLFNSKSRPKLDVLPVGSVKVDNDNIVLPSVESAEDDAVVEPDANVDDNVLVEGCSDSVVLGKVVAEEQRGDESLKGCFKLAKQGKGHFVIENGLLYHRDKILGQTLLQLVVPIDRRKHVLEVGHSTHGGHMGGKRTKERIAYTFYWPSMYDDCREFVKTCKVCQLKKRVTYRDRVPIQPIARADRVFDHWFIDCAGPFFSGEGSKPKYNYAFIAIDSFSRFPACFPLKSMHAKSICDALLSLWQYTGCCSHISSDLGTNFCSQLTQEFEKRMGCSPRFNSPWHPNSTGLVERAVGNVKTIVSKLAMDHPRQWHEYVPSVMWALRETPNSTTGVAPWTLVMGHLPKGPLSILKDSWMDDSELPVSFGKSNTDYLQSLHEKLKVAKEYATSHSDREQSRYTKYYNLRSQDKHFEVGEQVLILMPDSNSSKMFSKWMGPATIVAVRSPYSYLVDYDGAKRHFHANKLRKFHVRVESVTCDPVVCNFADVDDDISGECSVSSCAIVYDEDVDFGHLEVVPENLCEPNDVVLPSKQIDRESLRHLNVGQQNELLKLLDKYADCFIDRPGFTDKVTHKILLKDGFKPKRLPSYRVPEKLRPEVDRQIQEMLRCGIIRKSTSSMASPLVCVLKGKDGCNGIRLAVDYRYVNSYTHGDTYPLPDLQSVFQRVGRSNLISVCDCRSGYWAVPVFEEHKWLTAFVCDAGVFEFNRAPFGLKGSGCSFVRAITEILRPVREFTDSFVDDVAVHSSEWREHLDHLDKFLDKVKRSGLTLNLKKCRWAQNQVKFCGKIIGSGKQLADPEKLQIIRDMSPPKTQRELRRSLGFFSYFREHIRNFAEVAKPLTDLTTKRFRVRIPWDESQQRAFDELKTLLQKATEEPLYTIDFSKPFNLFVDASAFMVAAALTQTDPKGNELPIAFSSAKLTHTQCRWSTVEKEAYAALFALRKYRNWLFGSKVTLYSDHNPLCYLTESAPKSAKLMRWSLALTEFDLEFRYYPGKKNIVADCLSRLD